MAITSEQAAQVAAAYNAGQPSGDLSGVQSLVNQYGVTSADVQQYYPGFDVAAHAPGITLAELSGGSGGAPSAPAPNYNDIINQAYGSIGINQADKPGFDYWQSQLSSGAITPENFQQQFLTTASGVTDPQYAANVTQAQNLLRNLGTPEDFTARTGFGYGDAMDYILANIQDPTKIYQKAQETGTTAEDILAAQQWYYRNDPSKVPTLDAINQYLSEGQGGYQTRFDQILTSTFGDVTNRELLADAFGATTGQRPEAFSFADIINPDQYSTKSLEKIQEELINSDANRFQEGYRVADMARNLFGVDTAEARALARDLISGESDNELANKVYNQYLTKGTLDNETYTEMMRGAASINPDAAIFQRNPELYNRYRPLQDLEASQGTAGGLGYYNNAPILDAAEVDNVLKGGNIALDFRSGRSDDNAMGWDLNSRDAGSIRTGVAIFGVTSDANQAKAYTELENSLADLGQIKYVEPSGDESGYYVAETIKTDSDGNQYVAREAVPPEYASYEEERGRLENAAKQVGLDPAQYTSFDDLYSAVQDKTDDLYMVTGRTSGWDPTVAAETGIKTLTSDAGDMNHARVMYRREGDRLVAISDPTIFTANDKRRSGFATQVAPYAPLIAMATLPFGGVGGALSSGLGALAGTTLPAWAPMALNMAYSTAMSGGDFNDFIRNNITASITQQLSTALSQGLAGLDIGLTSGQVKGLSDLAAGAMTTLAREGDVGRFLENQGINTLLNEGIDRLGESLGLDTNGMSAEEKTILATVLPAVISGNFDQGTIMSLASKLATERSNTEATRTKVTGKE